MFSSFLQLKDCVLEHPFPIPKESLEALLDIFQKKEDSSMPFIRSLGKPTNLPRSLLWVIGRGGFGVVYDDKRGNAVKFYRENHSYRIKEDSLVLDTFVENIMFYVLFKAILAKACKCGLTKTNLSLHILSIDEIFSWEEEGGWVIGYTSKLHKNEWDEKYAPDVYSILKELNELTKHGVFLTHGDVTIGNIVIDENDSPLLIDFDISSVVVEFYNPLTGSPKGEKKFQRKIKPVQENVQFISNAIPYSVDKNTPKDLKLIDIVIFGCRHSVIRKSYANLEKAFGGLGGGTNYYEITYNNFIGKDIEFDKVMDVLTC